MSTTAETFKENYATLERIANRLAQDDDIDIDELVPLVDQASRAYQQCKARLDAVEKALQERLNLDEEETA